MHIKKKNNFNKKFFLFLISNAMFFKFIINKIVLIIKKNVNELFRLISKKEIINKKKLDLKYLMKNNLHY